MILPILTYPHEVLRRKAEEIKDIKSPEVKELILDMLETLENANGLGLAAPQVGKSLRLCIVKNDREPKSGLYILINPKIKSKSWRKELEEEGCLSFPGKFIPIKRHAKIRVAAFDKDGKSFVLKASGLLARALQHEIDHLNGVLLVDKETKSKKQ